MATAKDDSGVVTFMTLFQKLRDAIDDDPADLESIAADDESITKLCLDLEMAATFLSMNERRYRQLFVKPVDPKFIEAWREYEERYALPLAGIFLSDLGLYRDNSAIAAKQRFEVRREIADDDAAEQANAIERALEFAAEQASQDWRDFPDGFPESIDDGISAWKRLVEATGFDLRGIFRRRELVPVVLVPRHVSRHYGETEKLSLFTHLQQAHDAYVFGVPYVALALMRSVLEAMLKNHYHT